MKIQPVSWLHTQILSLCPVPGFRQNKTWKVEWVTKQMFRQNTEQSRSQHSAVAASAHNTQHASQSAHGLGSDNITFIHTYVITHLLS